MDIPYHIEQKLNALPHRMREAAHQRLMSDCYPFTPSNFGEAYGEMQNTPVCKAFCAALESGEGLIALEKGREMTFEYWVDWVIRYGNGAAEKDEADIRSMRSQDARVFSNAPWPLPGRAA